MKALKRLCLAMTCLSLGSLGFSDSSPSYIQAYYGTGTKHNTQVYTLDYNGNVVSNNATSNGLEIDPSSALTGISASSLIAPVASFTTLQSTGAAITMTSTPTMNVTGVADGTYVFLTTTGTVTITLQDNATLAGSKLHLGAATRAIGADKIIELIYLAASGFWYELGYANNN